MSDLQHGHYVQVGPATELLRWRRMGRATSCLTFQLNRISSGTFPSAARHPALCRGGALLTCEDGAVPGLLPNWRDSCGTRLVDVLLFPPTSMRWK